MKPEGGRFNVASTTGLVGPANQKGRGWGGVGPLIAKFLFGRRDQLTGAIN